MIITVEIKSENGKTRMERALVDSGAQRNLVAQQLVKEVGWSEGVTGPKLESVDGSDIFVYGNHQIELQATDTINRSITALHDFSAVDLKVPGVSMVLGYPWLWHMDPSISFRSGAWEYRKLKGIEVHEPERFMKELEDENVLAGCFIYEPDVDSFQIGGVSAAQSTVIMPVKYQEYADVADDSQAGLLPEHHPMEHRIDLEEGKQPPWSPIYNLSEPELQELRSYLDTFTRTGRIRRSISPAGAPILFVPKKDGTLRLCVDYRDLNEVTIKNRTPLPLISETLDRLGRAKIFTKLDLKEAYHRIRIKAGDEWKSAFRTRYGHFEFMVMPFGLANALATFQADINQALVGLVDVTCVVYLDDILIFSEDPDTHESAVKEILERLRQHHLYINLKKCQFHTKSVEFLGFIISTEGISMDPARVESIVGWPEPTSVRDIQVFLGFTNFYRRFVKFYSKVARPLTDATRKNPGVTFQLSDEAKIAFTALKVFFTEAPLLRHYHPDAPSMVETDASGKAIAGIFSQLLPDEVTGDKQWHPVAFYSRKMTDIEARYETHDAELLAIIQAFKHWSHYLRGVKMPTVVRTDHNNLKYFMKTKKLSGRQARWAELLAQFDFIIEHRPGRTNPADGPSRRPDYYYDEETLDEILPTLRAKLRVAKEKAQYGKETAFINSVIQQLGQLLLTESNELHSFNAEEKQNLISIGPQSDLDFIINFGGTQDSDSQMSEGQNSIPTSLEEGCHQLMDIDETSIILSDSGVQSTPDSEQAHVTGCKQYISRSLVATAAEAESVTEPCSEQLRDLIFKVQQGDAFVQKMKSDLTAAGQGDVSKSKSLSQWVVEDDLLLYRGSIWVPPESALRQEIIAIHHDDPYSGHFGVRRTKNLIGRKFVWNQMSADVLKYVSSCPVCQRTVVKRHKPYGKLASLPIPSRPWEEITMDFVTSLPPSVWRGQVYDSILVVVDRFSKMARYMPVRKDMTATDLATLYAESIFKDFGAPKGIVSDRGSLFTSEFWSAFMLYLNVRRRLSTAFHPQTDGQTERMNQVLEHYLRVYCNYRQDDWTTRLSLAEFVYNNSVHASTNMTPFKACYGFDPELRYIDAADKSPTSDIASAAKARVIAIDKERELLKANLEKAIGHQQKYYNKHHIDKTYKMVIW